MSGAAITAARTVGYVGAGTVEFLVDGQQHFYFMEMNTRLQVEHPVTEFITGVDLVEWQIRVARGERLGEAPMARVDAARGAAIEARVYAEDPAQDYLPSVGRITHLEWPRAADGLRLDVGFEGGDEVSSFYDPMLGKIIAWGGSRAAAIGVLRRGLADLEITGVLTNRALLASVLADEEFLRANVATDFLRVRAAHLAFGEAAPTDEDLVLAALWYTTRDRGIEAPWQDTRGWRLGAAPRSAWRFGERLVTVEAGSPTTICRIAGREFAASVLASGAWFDVELAGRRVRAHMVEVGSQLHVFANGGHAALRLALTEDALDVEAVAEEGSLKTPLPGTVVALHVSEGQRVPRGAALVTVEAMKMEHTLTAPHAGIVGRVLVGVADRVPADAVLLELAPACATSA
jgi:3-methylcrotonyl-CoA carboxylase alpha subunit